MRRDDFHLSAHIPLRMSTDERTAAFGLNADLYGQSDAVYVYLLQDIAGSDYAILLLFIFFPNLWEEKDLAILEELSEFIGIDLIAYLPW